MNKPEKLQPRNVPNTPFFATTNYSSNEHKKIILNILALTDYTIKELKIYVKK